MTEQAVLFSCAGEQLVGILASPPGSSTLGVLVIVGGPQYRVGSHRQFVLLSRCLAREGIPVLRFDFRGMGDSTGDPATFEQTVPDISAAIEALLRQCPSIERVVLWGLCDAASAALLYWRATRDRRVAGMVLLNPWVRSDQSLATTRVKHYYGKRLLEPQFWSKLTSGGVNVVGALREFAGNVVSARSRANHDERGREAGFQDRMATALSDFQRPVLLILSGQDYTAKEFLEYSGSNPRWRGLTGQPNVERTDLTKADHTFSTGAWRHDVERLTVEWLTRSFPKGAT